MPIKAEAGVDCRMRDGFALASSAKFAQKPRANVKIEI